MDAQKPLVLVVEDSAVTRRLFTESLEHAGYRVVPCETASAAFAQLEAHREVQVVLLDLNLPDQSGMVVLRELRQMRPDAICLIVTGYQSTESMVEATELGVDEYLIKPIRPEDLPLVVMRAMLRRRLELQRYGQQQPAMLADDLSHLRHAAASHASRMAELSRQIAELQQQLAQLVRQQRGGRGAAEAGP